MWFQFLFKFGGQMSTLNADTSPTLQEVALGCGKLRNLVRQHNPIQLKLNPFESGATGFEVAPN